MNNLRRFLPAVLSIAVFGCTQPEGDAGRALLEPPVAKIEPHEITDHGYMSDAAGSEWGDEREALYRDILTYSPYENVEAKDYPNTLVTSGLYDTQVQYWGPAKWVAKLRALKTDDHVLLFQTAMDGGHTGSSGRYQRWNELAFLYAFILDLAGIAE